ncbi:MAG: hypothetical protein FK730_15090 [Asgard group archaeon]|nr:hypothetical protein [Asgard group archaeon]
MSDDENSDLQPNQNETILQKDTSDHNKEELQNDQSTKDHKDGAFKNILKGLFKWSTIQLLLAHHPDCKEYESHVFKIGKLRLCRGCTLSYPPAYALPLIFIFWQTAQDFFLAKALWFHNLLWFTLGFILLTIITLITRRYSKIINDIYKFTRGALLGFLFIVVIGEVRTSTWYLAIISGVMILSGLFYLSVKRGKDMEKTCNECEWGAEFYSCPGWKDLSDNFQLSPTPTINNKQIEANYETKELDILNISETE